jgi:hypothetical protein
MHNSIPEYASTTSISIVMTMPFHVMPFEKRFLRKWFSPQISSKPPSPHKTEQRKKREKKEEKLEESLQIKGKLIFWEEKKHFNFKKSFFWCDSIFSPSITEIQKPFPKSLRKFS